MKSNELAWKEEGKEKKKKGKLQLSQIQTPIVFLPLVKCPCIFVGVYNLYR